ncbi:MAG: 3-methyl-2-oxobutanoate hydroxymethyltransferase [Candidatus Cloacimonas sp.]|nr:3-methyl-2-oxobutanoate hydroxymethyltransferase [Candidatus Cloacimonadota bacterium]
MIGIKQIKEKKAKQERITMLTAYDYFTAKLMEEAGIETLLVGDSLGNVFKGEGNTLSVTVDEIIYHTKAVRKGAPNTFIIADMPFMSYHLNTTDTKINAARLIIEGGANAVKLEGGSQSRIEMIKSILDCEIPVVAHLGLTPQSIAKIGDFKVQGRQEEEAVKLIEQAKSVEQAGAFMLVLEAVPEKLGKEISETLSIPIIGIGAGRYTDGQVLVINDLIGLSDYQAKFTKIFVDLKKGLLDGIKDYYNEVKQGEFPKKANTYYPIDDTKSKIGV